MDHTWEESRRAFADAAAWFAGTVAGIDGGWDRPGLGEWDLRALVGHTSRSLLTVEAYLERPADAVEVASAVDYFRTTSAAAAAAGVADRGREAGAALGDDPAAAIAGIAARVTDLVRHRGADDLLVTFAGGMRLRDYLPTRTFELTVHTADLAAALGRPAEIPPSAAAQTLRIVTDLAVATGRAGPLLMAATGRSVPGLSVL